MPTTPLDTAIADLQAEVTANLTVGASAIAYIQGVPALIQAAVDAATAQGATPAQLASITALKTSLQAETQNFVNALTANTQP